MRRAPDQAGRECLPVPLFAGGFGRCLRLVGGRRRGGGWWLNAQAFDNGLIQCLDLGFDQTTGLRHELLGQSFLHVTPKLLEFLVDR